MKNKTTVKDLNSLLEPYGLHILTYSPRDGAKRYKIMPLKYYDYFQYTGLAHAKGLKEAEKATLALIEGIKWADKINNK